MKLLDDFIDTRSGLEVLEDRSHRHARIFEHPGAAALAGDAFDGGALRPIEGCHFLPPLTQPYYHIPGLDSKLPTLSAWTDGKTCCILVAEVSQGEFDASEIGVVVVADGEGDVDGVAG